MKRCAWARSPAMIAYHDREWGRPVHDDCVLFEFITLEGAQAGLSWETILAKREAYRRAFACFDPARVARFSAARRAKLMLDAGIVRNRLKIESTVTNAAAFLRVQEELGSFDRFLWEFAGGKPIRSRGGRPPAGTELSDRFSKELKRRGFRFVGTTICYAFLQAVGVVNDHSAGCFRHGKR
jgi:DNA-3-methyladenine glycosylase I